VGIGAASWSSAAAGSRGGGGGGESLAVAFSLVVEPEVHGYGAEEDGAGD
jgi:hypothetical protein